MYRGKKTKKKFGMWSSYSLNIEILNGIEWVFSVWPSFLIPVRAEQA